MLEWLQNPVVSIGLAIALMFFGYFFGLFEGRGQGYKRRQAEEQENSESEPISEPVLPADPPRSRGEFPVLDVGMGAGGELIVKLDDESIEPATMNADQRKRMISLLTQMRPWLEPQTPTRPPAQPRPAPPVSRPNFVSNPVPATSAVKTAPVDEEKETAPQSIVGQINSILQMQLAGSALVEKGLSLQESPEGGVLVWVGMNRYEGIDDVPDETIKSAIRAAIAEWENKFTPGL